MKRVLYVILIALVLMGCTRIYGSPSVKEAFITKNLPVVGTTKDELIRRFGQPSSTEGKIWYFHYLEADDKSLNPYCTVCCPPSTKALILGGIILPLLLSDCFFDENWRIMVVLDDSFKVERSNATYSKSCRSGFLLMEGHSNILESVAYP